MKISLKIFVVVLTILSLIQFDLPWSLSCQLFFSIGLDSEAAAVASVQKPSSQLRSETLRLSFQVVHWDSNQALFGSELIFLPLGCFMTTRQLLLS